MKLKTRVHTTISDITESILRIEKFKIFDEIKLIDFTKSVNLKNENSTIVILSRIDTELSDSQLKNLFKNLYDSDIEYLLFIPAQLITFQSILIQFYIIIKSILFRKKLVDCGSSRSRSRFIRIWSLYYDIDQKYKFNNVFLKKRNL